MAVMVSHSKPPVNPCFLCLSACQSCPYLDTPKRRQITRALVAAVKAGDFRFETAMERWKSKLPIS